MKIEAVLADQHRPYILQNLGQFSQRRILVVGDLGLDEYVTGDVKRISPEAPVPVLEVEREESRLGLSGNVAQNITSLGAQATLVSVVGNDTAASSLRQLLQEAKVQSQLLVDSQRPTTRKLRVMSGQHHLVRVDFEHKTYLPPELSNQLLQTIKTALPEHDGLIVQDYAKGLFHKDLLQEIFKVARAGSKQVFVDPHRTTPLSYYRGADLLTPNYDESLALAGIESDAFVDPLELLQSVGEKITQVVGSSRLVITLGKKGMRLIDNGRLVDLPTYARQVFDVTGAGDTVIATIALACLSGFSLEQACVAANYAAGVVVSKTGCVPCRVDELKEYIAL